MGLMLFLGINTLNCGCVGVEVTETAMARAMTYLASSLRHQTSESIDGPGSESVVLQM